MLDDLSQNEKNRASAFVDLKSKKQFVVMRSILKKIVRNWFGKKTASIKLTNKNKPYVVGAPHFNISHSGNFGLIAFDNFSPVGVDIQTLQDNLTAQEMIRISEFAFHRDQHNQLINLTNPVMKHAFQSIWVKREALLKAAGVGLTTNPNCLNFSEADIQETIEFYPDIKLNEFEWKTFVKKEGRLPKANEWFLVDLVVNSMCKASVAYASLGGKRSVAFRLWNSIYA